MTLADCNHATVQRYWSGCRCDACRGANRVYERERRSGIMSQHEHDLFWAMHQQIVALRRRCKAKHRQLTITDDDLIALYLAQEGRCALSGRHLVINPVDVRNPDALSIDRIDSSKGYTPDNIRLVTTSVNLALSDLGTPAFVRMCVSVVQALAKG